MLFALFGTCVALFTTLFDVDHIVFTLQVRLLCILEHQSLAEKAGLLYNYSITNRLTDCATQRLLDLVARHCPTPNSCPETVHKLKKRLQPSADCIHSKYGSLCMSPINDKSCSKCSSKTAQVCYYTILPFEDHLKDIIRGMYIAH